MSEAASPTHGDTTGHPPDNAATEAGRSGFIAIVGRPNVGKSTLVNRILGTKVSITAATPNTTRRRIHGVLNRPGVQAVFVDTPGVHKPKTALGSRLNEQARASLDDVDVACLVVDATAPVGPGDRRIASTLPRDAVVVVNKIDLAQPKQALAQLSRAHDELGLSDAEYFPVSAKSGLGVDALVDHLIARLPEGPPLFPEGTVSDVPEAFFVAELVREQLLKTVRDELPHSIACEVTEWEWPYIRCEILVERQSQRPIVVGSKGQVLKSVGQAVRRQLPDGAYLDLHVSVERDWQRHRELIDRLGY
ncbi:MAG: GTPase Era [Acidimicrobiales bacterium]